MIERIHIVCVVFVFLTGVIAIFKQHVTELQCEKLSKSYLNSKHIKVAFIHSFISIQP